MFNILKLIMEDTTGVTNYFNGKNTSELIWDFVSQFNIDGTIN